MKTTIPPGAAGSVPRARAFRAFTLIELLPVIARNAIFAARLLPGPSNMPKQMIRLVWAM